MSLSTSPKSTVDNPLFLSLLNDNDNNDKTTITTTATTSTEDSKTINDSQKEERLNLQEFIQELPNAIEHRKKKSIEPGAWNDPICNLFRKTKFSKDEWKLYAKFDMNRPYTRNLIATDYKTYTILLLCWNPNQESPIHNHPCDGCWLTVCQGCIEETKYSSSNLELLSKEQFSYTNNNNNNGDGTTDVSYITDSIGYHKVGNPSLIEPAVTLHVYSPPFQQCHIWANPTTTASTSLSSSTTTTTNFESSSCPNSTMSSSKTTAAATTTNTTNDATTATTATTITTSKNNDDISSMMMAVPPLRCCDQIHYSEYGRVL